MRFILMQERYERWSAVVDNTSLGIGVCTIQFQRMRLANRLSGSPGIAAAPAEVRGPVLRGFQRKVLDAQVDK